jgi:hypothetical protein
MNQLLNCKCTHIDYCYLPLIILCLPGGGVLKLVRIKSFKKKITFLILGFIVVAVADIKIVQSKQIQYGNMDKWQAIK